MLEGVEKLEELVVDPLAITATADAGRNEYARLFKSVESCARGGRRHRVVSGGDLGAQNGVVRQPKDDLSSNRVCSW